MAATGQGGGRVEALDLLRGLAVLAVVLFHYGFRGAVGDEGFTAISLPALVPFVKYGSLGVQLFFVISGFVIAYSAERRSALEFGIARIGRIYPAFIVCMTVTFIATLVIGAPHFEASAAQWLANLAIAAPALHRPFMDGAYWSLVYEMTFYTWIALFIRAGWFPRHLDLIVAAWMVLAVLNRELHFAVLQRGLLTDQSGFFAAGLVIYGLYRGRQDLTIKLLLALSTVVAIGQAQDLMQWGRVHLHTTYSDAVAAAIAVAAIAAVALAVRVRRLPFSPNLVATIGAVTYPLYLLHQHIGYMIFNRLAGIVTPWLLFAATAAAMVLLAFAVQRYIERPGQRLLKRSLTAAAAQLSAGAVILGMTMRELTGMTRAARRRGLAS